MAGQANGITWPNAATMVHTAVKHDSGALYAISLTASMLRLREGMSFIVIGKMLQSGRRMVIVEGMLREQIEWTKDILLWMQFRHLRGAVSGSRYMLRARSGRGAPETPQRPGRQKAYT